MIAFAQVMMVVLVMFEPPGLTKDDNSLKSFSVGVQQHNGYGIVFFVLVLISLWEMESLARLVACALLATGAVGVLTVPTTDSSHNIWAFLVVAALGLYSIAMWWSRRTSGLGILLELAALVVKFTVTSSVAWTQLVFVLGFWCDVIEWRSCCD